MARVSSRPRAAESAPRAQGSLPTGSAPELPARQGAVDRRPRRPRPLPVSPARHRTLACRRGAAPAPDRRAAEGAAVNATERWRNAAAAARPARACARVAIRSSSAATSSSGLVAAAAKCHARCSGSFSASVAAASAKCAADRSSRVAAAYAADLTRGWRNLAPAPISSSCSESAVAAASRPMSSLCAARQSSVASPVGSAAATSISCRVCSGSALIRRR